MKKLFLFIFSSILLLGVTSCKQSNAEQELAQLRDSLNNAKVEQQKLYDDSIKKVQEEQRQQAIADSIANVLENEITSTISTFYNKSYNAQPILSMTSPSFDKALRTCQARSDYNGQKGTICYMLWQHWLYGSAYWISSYTPIYGTVKMTDTTHANCLVNLKYILEVEDRQEHNHFDDNFKFVKINGIWKIDDIVRDGTSMKSYWTRNNVYIP